MAYDDVPSVGTTALAFFVNVGSRDESASEWGIAHMLEHLVFKGASSRDNRSIAAQMDALGGDMNAFTSRDYTCFYAKVLDEKAVDALALLADLMRFPWLKDEDLAREKNVVSEEMRESLDDPDDVVDTLMTEALYEDAEYVHDILGTESSLYAMTHESVRQFHHKHYHPRNIVLAVSGGARDNLLTGARSLFEDMRIPSPTAGRTPPSMHHTLRTMRRNWEQVRVAWGTPAPTRYHPDYCQALVAASLLGGQNTSRLWQRLREDEGLVYSVSTQYSAETDAGDVVTYLGMEDRHLDRALQALYEEMEHLREYGPSSEEIARTLMYLQTILVMNQETPDARVMRLGRYALDHLLAPEVQSLNHALALTTIEGVKAQLRLWTRPEMSALAVAGPLPPRFRPPQTIMLGGV